MFPVSLATHSKQNSQRNIRRAREYKWRRPELIGDSQHQLARMPRGPIEIPAQTSIEVPPRGRGGGGGNREHTATRGSGSPCFFFSHYLFFFFSLVSVEMRMDMRISLQNVTRIKRTSFGGCSAFWAGVLFLVRARDEGSLNTTSSMLPPGADDKQTVVGRATANGLKTRALCIRLHPVSATRRQAHFP